MRIKSTSEHHDWQQAPDLHGLTSSSQGYVNSSFLAGALSAAQQHPLLAPMSGVGRELVLLVVVNSRDQ